MIQAFRRIDWAPVLNAAARAGLVVLIWIIGLSALDPLPAPETGRPDALMPCARGGVEGYLSGRIYGSVDLSLDWRSPRLLCEGMPRPDGEGLRLVFAHAIDDSAARLMLVLGLPDATLTGTTGEIPANVTLIDEANGRFFGTGGTGRCWADIQSQLPAEPDRVWVRGELYCAGALPELGADGSVTLGDLAFKGQAATEPMEDLEPVALP